MPEAARRIRAGFGAAGGVGSDLRRPSAVLAVLIKVCFDLTAAGRELPQHRPVDAIDVGDAVPDSSPLDPQPLGEFPPQVSLIQAANAADHA